MYAEKTAIISWEVHLEGYNVLVLGENGEFIDEYSAGNSRQDSTAYEPDVRFAVTEEELEDYALDTARSMVEELRAAGYRVLGLPD